MATLATSAGACCCPCVAPCIPIHLAMTPVLWFGALFAVPFAGAGLFAGYESVQSALAGDWERAAFLAVFFLVFGGIGVGLLVAITLGRRVAFARLAEERRHPAEPWLWREDW